TPERMIPDADLKGPMLRKIPIDQLVPGMYVEQLDRSWLLVPVFRNPIVSGDQVRKLKEWDVREVVIDTDKGTDSPAAATGPASGPAGRPDPVPYEVELSGANTIYEEALDSVSRMMDAVRNGEKPDVALADATVDELIGSVLRNRDALASLLSLKEHSDATFQHCVRVCILTLVFCTRLGFARSESKSVGIGALLHDIGKTQLPLALVEKQTPYEAEEFQDYRTHPLLGAQLFDQASGIEKRSLLVLLQHHERSDGSGFPQGLVKDEISRMASMVMIVDTYDNLTTGRQGKARMTPYEALQWIRQWGGPGFDAQLVDEFVSALGLYPVGSFVRLSDHRLGIVLAVHHNPALLPKVWVVFDAQHRMLPEGETIDMAHQPSSSPLSIVTSLLPQKLGFDLPGYVRERGLLTGQVPEPEPETRHIS
ncbi:MAG: HD domain-containing phosphohydrolase, partial [bacterium]